MYTIASCAQIDIARDDGLYYNSPYIARIIPDAKRTAMTKLNFLTKISTATLLGMVLLAQAQAQTLAPVNPAFLRFQTKKAAAKNTATATVGVTGKAKGYIPGPVNLSALAGRSIVGLRNTVGRAAVAATPNATSDSYDLRTYNYVTPIRDQSTCGDCWAFATYSSLESSLIMRSTETWDLSENNLKNKSGFDYGECVGGTSLMSAAYLTRWDGPVTETQDPYNVSASATSPSGLTPSKHSQEILMLPSRTSATDNANIKWAVQNYGAIYVSMYADTGMSNSADSSYYKAANAAYCYTGSEDADHAVAIVGWDDTYAASNFSTPPAGNGAFIVRNNWGTDWGESGYFYVSYYDTVFGYGELTAFDLNQPTTNYDSIYQYDLLGWVTSIGYGSTTGYFANVFTASSSQSLSAVGFYTDDINASYTVKIYTGVSGTTSPTAGTLAYTGNGTLANAGYHTVAITTPVAITSGTKFSIVVTVTNTSDNYPIPIQAAYTGYSSGAATTVAGRSFYSADGTSWSDTLSLALGTGYTTGKTNVNLKAYMQNAIAPVKVYDGATTGTETAYSASATQLSANWTASAGTATGYQYKIWTSSGDITNWTSAGTNLSVTVTGLTLTSGITYYFAVRTMDNSLYSGQTNSSGVTVDAAAPTISAVYDGTSATETQYTKSSSALNANWTAAYDAVGISKYSYAVGTTSGGSEKVAWTDSGTATALALTGLSLADGTTYFVSVKATNMAGVQQSVATVSHGVLVDITAPTTPSITSKPASYYPGKAPPFAWSSTDTGSHLAGYAMGLTIGSSCSLGSSTNTVTASSAPVVAADGAYIFCVKAFDNAGNASATSSYQFTVLSSSPALTVTVSTPIARPGAAGFTLASTQSLGTAPEVSVTQPGGGATSVTMTSSNNLLWTGSYTVLPLSDGVSTITITNAANLAGNYSTGTKNFIVDVTSPTGTMNMTSLPTPANETFSMTVTEVDNNVNTASTPTVTFSDGVNYRACSPVTYVTLSTWTAACFLDSSFSSGTAHVYLSATDLAGNASSTTTAIGSFSYDTSVGGTAGGTVVATDSTTVIIPANANTTAFFVNISSVPDSNSTITAANGNTTGSIIVSGANLSRQFTATTAAGAAVTAFQTPVTIKLYYHAGSNGFVDGTILPVKSLGVYYLNQVTNTWTQVPGATACATGTCMTAAVSHFSLYALRSSDTDAAAYAGFDTVKAWPNPCKFHASPYQMVIGGVGPYVTGLEIRIYTLSGQLVRTFTNSSGIQQNQAIWDGKNENGEKVASGVYLILFKADALDPKTFKAAVIW